MKVFAVTTNLILVQKPDWFDRAREKYNQSFDLHITLKQPCFIEDEEISKLKEKLLHFFQLYKFNSTTLSFDKVVFDKEESGWTIMLSCESDEIRTLQKQICQELSSYTNYVNTETEEYEKNFVPHMTFATDLSDSQYEEIKSVFSDQYQCKGEANKSLLLIASEDSKKILEQVEYVLLS